MQVKKFEAKTMKDALELVKVHLGPEAIILSAKDSHRGFGLMGEKSVEVTAAVSEETLRKKKIAEARLREDLRAKFQQIPASKQKEFINKVFNDTRELVTADGQVQKQKISADTRAQLKGVRYIDIDDDVEQQSQSEQGRERVKRAAQAASAGMAAFVEPKPKARKPVQQQQVKVPQAAVQAQQEAQAQLNAQIAQHQLQSSAEVQALQSQVRELKTLVEQFQKIPQLPMTMHPGAEQGLPYELSAMYQRLTTQGVNPQLVTNMLKKATKEIDPESIKKSSMVDAWMVRNILNSVEVTKTPLQGRYHVFMGCTGQGKTSTLVKFASNLLLKEKKTIAIISLDTIKVGAADQLRIYAQILNVPFAIVRSPEEWQVAQQKLAHVQHILVDCPGFNLQTMEEVNWLKRMIPPAEMNRQIHYVQSILARDEETFDIAGRYQMLGFHDVIFTRLDESSRQGLILNFQERFKVPLHSFGTGSRIPEDYEFATKERVVDFLFKLTKVSKREE
jgi:flagellar biosynthesis protein FlhF